MRSGAAAMIILRKRVGSLTKGTLDRFVTRAREAARLAGSINVVVTSSARMRALNKRFRGKDQPTDVLSFPAVPGAAADGVGEIAISAEIARKNARMLGHTVAEEIKILVLHGILHLRGYDHDNDRGEMARHESRLRALLRLPVGLIERATVTEEKKSGDVKNPRAAASRQRAIAGCGKTAELGTTGKGTSSTRAGSGAKSTRLPAAEGLPAREMTFSATSSTGAASRSKSSAASSRWGTARPRTNSSRRVSAARTGRKPSQ